MSRKILILRSLPNTELGKKSEPPAEDIAESREQEALDRARPVDRVEGSPGL